MAGNSDKDWTVLIYANGNNDLEPEMWQAVSNLTKVEPNSNINAVIQIGRADDKLIKLLRKNNLPESGENWDGVQRYFLANSRLNLAGKLRKINMADPRQLYEFIKWGMQTYPAKRYMLILGGHGYQFVGTMIDYTQKAPCIMGIPEMVKAINKGAVKSGGKIDILVLDVCYSNYIEVIYELGKDAKHKVENAITYISNGPIQGLPYDEIIELLQNSGCNIDTLEVIRVLLDKLSYDLVAYSVNYKMLKHIKKKINELASSYCTGNKSEGMTHLSAILGGEGKLAEDIKESLSSLVVGFKRVSKSITPVIDIADEPTGNLNVISRYYRLAFAQHNFWTYLLSKKSFDINAAIERRNVLLPLKLGRQEIYAFISIMNPALQDEQKDQILRELYTQRNWE